MCSPVCAKHAEGSSTSRTLHYSTACIYITCHIRDVFFHIHRLMAALYYSGLREPLYSHHKVISDFIYPHITFGVLLSHFGYVLTWYTNTCLYEWGLQKSMGICSLAIFTHILHWNTCVKECVLCIPLLSDLHLVKSDLSHIYVFSVSIDWGKIRVRKKLKDVAEIYKYPSDF